MVVELENNTGKDFAGHNGDIIKAGANFYMVAKLDPTTNNMGEVKQPGSETLTKVFQQDYTTVANLTIMENSDTNHDKGLGAAYNVIPDLRTPALSIGMSVDLNWQSGLTFNHTEGRRTALGIIDGYGGGIAVEEPDKVNKDTYPYIIFCTFYYYQLHESSLAINADKENFTLPERFKEYVNLASDRDVLGNPRTLGGKVDMGCFETWRIADGCLQVRGIESGDLVIVRTLSGLSVTRGRAVSDTFVTQPLVQGVYIVTVNNRSKKVAVHTRL